MTFRNSEIYIYIHTYFYRCCRVLHGCITLLKCQSLESMWQIWVFPFASAAHKYPETLDWCIFPSARSRALSENMVLTARREGTMRGGRSGKQRDSEGGGDNWIICTMEWWGARGAANGGRDVLFSEANCWERAEPLFREALLLSRCTYMLTTV